VCSSDLRSRHVLAIFDSCFSGNVFETTRAMRSPAITRAISLPVRQIISSGEAGQTVSDDGLFRELFLGALSGEEANADANHDGYLTGSELGLFLGDKVTSLTLNRQTPRFGTLRARGFDRGDFVFRVAVSSDKAAPGAVVADAPSRGEAPAAAAEPVWLQPKTPKPAAPVPTPSATSQARFHLNGNRTALLMDGRLAFTMARTPTGGRSDLVAVVVNGQTTTLSVGGSVAGDDGRDGCSLTLLQILKGKNRAEFLSRCGPVDAAAPRQGGRVSVDLPDRLTTLETFTMQGGTSEILSPAPAILSVIGTPFGGRGDLVGLVFNGKTHTLGPGQQIEVYVAGQQCTLGVTRIRNGENQADFLWRCH